jgi:hypothetical protein
MKQVTFLLLASIVILGLNSCTKSNVVFSPLSSLEIVNTVPNSPGAQLFGLPNAVAYGSYGQFGLIASNSTQIYVWPTGDSAMPYYNTTIAAVNGGIYSLYLTGPSQNNAILMKDTIPSYTDSICGIRFINLSPDSKPVSVNIAGLPSGSLVSSLAYTSITAFNKLPAGNVAITNGYTFEIRNAADSTLLITYQQSVLPYKNQTIVFNGLEADMSFKAFTVNNY